MGKKQKLMY